MKSVDIRTRTRCQILGVSIDIDLNPSEVADTFPLYNVMDVHDSFSSKTQKYDPTLQYTYAFVYEAVAWVDALTHFGQRIFFIRAEYIEYMIFWSF